MKYFIASLCFCLSVAGCTSAVPMGEPRQDAALKEFTVASEQAGIFIYRNTYISDKMGVLLDEEPLGQTVAGTYLYETVMPGRHSITSIAENRDTLEVDLAPGSLAYVWQEAKVGIMFAARSKLHLVSEEEGRQGVRDGRLAMSVAKNQTIEVRVETADVALDGTLKCEASNQAGKWEFIAPGSVTVRKSASPLQISCKTLEGITVEALSTAPGNWTLSGSGAQKGAKIGTIAGGGAGLALGVAALPFSATLGLGIAAGSTFYGNLIGSMVGFAADRGIEQCYPSPLVIRVRKAARPD